MYGLLVPQATHQKLGWLDNPKNIGLLSAALGILANNKGNYGAFAPALGAGGLLGLQSAMQTQQQNILNRRNESRDARSDYFNREQLGLLKKEFGLKQEDSGLFRQSEYGQPSQIPQVAAAPAITNPVQQPYSEAGFQSQLASTGQATAPQVDVNASKLPSQLEEYRRMAETAYARAQRNAPFGSNKKVKAMIDADMSAAKNYADKADKLEAKLEQGTIGGIPGVTFNKTDGKFYENGSPITAQRVQELANKHADSADKRPTIANQLRQDFLTVSKSFKDVKEGYSRIVESAKNPSAAGDLSMIFSYMKILDPTSVVREGEQATAANARGVPEAVKSWYNRVLSGEKLSEDQRADFLNRAGMLYKSAESQQEQIEGQFEAMARRQMINPDDVVVRYRHGKSNVIHYDSQGNRVGK